MKMRYLIVSLVILCITVTSSLILATNVQTDYYELQVEAAYKMESLTEKVRSYKEYENIPLSSEDIFKTGLIGSDYNEFTTTLGDIEAKRTSVNPDMAALIVRMLIDIGIQNGDTIGVSMSGSFPGFNIAVLSAAEVMDLELKIVASFGSSTYGANQLKMSYPEINTRLYRDNHTPYQLSLVTLGGVDDVLADKDDETVSLIKERYENIGIDLYIEPDFDKNIEKKIEFLTSDGIDGYINIGGGVISLGQNPNKYSKDPGILKLSSYDNNLYKEGDGLVKYFLYNKIPVINLLNVRKLVTEYNMMFDSQSYPYIGSSSVYYIVEYPKILPIIGLTASIISLICYSRKKGIS